MSHDTHRSARDGSVLVLDGDDDARESPSEPRADQEPRADDFGYDDERLNSYERPDHQSDHHGQDDAPYGKMDDSADDAESAASAYADDTPAADSGFESESSAAEAESKAEDEYLGDETLSDEALNAEPLIDHKPSRWPALFAALLALGWTGAFIYARAEAMQAGAPLETWTLWVTQWSAPLVLIGVLWLVVMRSSGKEAARYGAMARALSSESHMLESRLAGMNRELGLARDFIAAQASELETLGRQASENISAHAAELHDMVGVNTARVETIAKVSGVALENMDRLKEDLPLISNSARDVAGDINGVGEAAASQLDALSAGFDKLEASGAESQKQITTLQDQLAQSITAMAEESAALEAAAEARMAALSKQNQAMRADFARHEDETAEAMRSRAEAWDALLSESRAAQEQAEQSALAALQTRITTIRESADLLRSAMHESEASALESWEARAAGLDQSLARIGEDIARLDALSEENARTRLSAFSDQAAALDTALQERHEAQLAQADAFARAGEDILKSFDALRGDMKAIAAQGHEVESGLAMGLELLSNKLRESRLALDTTGDTISELTRSANTLLGAIQASTRTSKEELATALAETGAQLEAVKADMGALDSTASAVREKGQAVSDLVMAAQGGSHETLEQLGAVATRLTEANATHEAAIAQLNAQFAALSAESDSLVKKTEGQLAGALDKLRQSSAKALESIESDTNSRITALGSTVGSRAAKEIERAVEAQTNGSLKELESAAENAAGLGKEVVVQLRDQLARVNELASNLEARVSRARERAEEQVGNDFSHRLALLNESLNSSGIDIAKALAADVTDAEWTSYLRGDRSIFVRRAVRLIDSSKAREIAKMFDNDPEFREHVSRYIHDFEAMLRTMLSTRDGHALSVTLLSSDAGKLYVVLAQAIERLRD